MNEVELVALVDHIGGPLHAHPSDCDWCTGRKVLARASRPDFLFNPPATLYFDQMTERDAEVANVELARRGSPYSVAPA